MVVSLPAWSPGSYTIRNFSAKVVLLEAFDPSGNTRLAVSQIGLSSWRVARGARAILLRATIVCNDTSFRGGYLAQSTRLGVIEQRGLLELPALCLLPEGMHQQPCRMHIAKKAVVGSNRFPTVACPLPASGRLVRGFGSYCADSYLALIDGPIMIGTMTSHSFFVAGVKHSVDLCGFPPLDSPFLSEIKQACRQIVALFGFVPFDAYRFMLLASKKGGGGLEHARSSSLHLPPRALPSARRRPRLAVKQAVLSLFAHEYFHAWLVKTITNKTTTTQHLFTPQPTANLWFFEGFTHYYELLILVRAKLITKAQFLKALHARLDRYRTSQAPTWQSVREASFTSWTRFYHPHPLSKHYDVSYYSGGMMVALCLDAQLRALGSRRNQPYSLDHLLRTMARERSRLGEDDIFDLVGSWYDKKTGAYLKQIAHERKHAPYQQALAHLGVSVGKAKQLTIANQRLFTQWVG